MVSATSWAEAGTSRATCSTNADAQAPLTRLGTYGLRCAQYGGASDEVVVAARRPIPLRAPMGSLEPFSDQVFEAYKARFTFDQVSMDARIVDTDLSNPVWRRQKVALRTLYGDEDLFVYLFLPAAAAGPFQPVVYFPGASAQNQRSPEELQTRMIDFVVQSGRAVIYPIYAGTHERRQAVIPRPDTRDGVDYVARLTGDLRRTLDYLETRDDIRFKTPVYYGFSWERTRPRCSWRWSHVCVPQCCSTAGSTPADAARNSPVGLCAARPDSRAHDQRVVRCDLSDRSEPETVVHAVGDAFRGQAACRVPHRALRVHRVSQPGDQEHSRLARPLSGSGAVIRTRRVRKGSGMARLVFGMNQSLDGYVDHMAFAPSPTLFRHFIEEAQGQAGSVYGRQIYEVMRYWDDDHPEWGAEEHAFAAAWRNQPKWVVSRSLKSVGPKATLVGEDLQGAIRELKAERDGEIEVAGPNLAQSLTELGLIDEYRIYLHPVVLGHGKPYFAGPRPRLRLMANDWIGEDVIRLAYVPA